MQIFYSDSVPPVPRDDEIAKLAASFANSFGTGADLVGNSSKIGQLQASAEEAGRFYATTAQEPDKIGKLGGAFGLAEAVAKIAAFDDKPREVFAQTAKYRAELFVLTYANGMAFEIAAAAGLLTSAPLTAGILVTAAAVGTVLYIDQVLGDQIVDEAKDWWDGVFGDDARQSGPELSTELSHVSPRAEEAAEAVVFDADWYLARYKDALAAVGSGALPSAYVHFLTTGISKGYLPSEDAARQDPKLRPDFDLVELKRLDIRPETINVR